MASEPTLGGALAKAKFKGGTGPGPSPSSAQSWFPRIDPIFILRLGRVLRVPLSYGTNKYNCKFMLLNRDC
jgi:hypothetical protein